MALHYWTQS